MVRKGPFWAVNEPLCLFPVIPGQFDEITNWIFAKNALSSE